MIKEACTDSLKDVGKLGGQQGYPLPEGPNTNSASESEALWTLQ